ncbi:MAG: SBBP repeat-containing protein [Sandaracinaceae bacterium]
MGEAPGVWPRLVIAFALLFSACTEGRATLLLNVQSDLLPGREASQVVTRLFRGLPEDAGEEERSVTANLEPSDELAEGLRVAELSGLPLGNWTLRVQLMSATGAVELERVALVDLEATTAITVVMTRSCRGVVCPAPGGDPRALACLGGRCVQPDCTPETPESCPPASCSDTAECPTPEAACASARCSRGECFTVGVDSMCAASEVCLPEMGCQSLMPAPDGGFQDGGIQDGGIHDGGTEDAGIPAAPTGMTTGVQPFGGNGDEEGYDLAVHAATGNVVVVGQFEDTLDFGTSSVSSNGGSDHFVAAFAPDGTNLWSRGAGSAISSEDRASGVAIDSAGNVYVAGHFSAGTDFGGGVRAGAGMWDAFVASYDAAGAYRWDWTMGGVDADLTYDVAISPDGSVWASGYYSGALEAGGETLPTAGGRDVFLIHLDGATGAHLDSRGWGTAAVDQSRAVTVDASGRPILAVTVGEPTDFGGDTVNGLAVVAFDGTLNPRWSREIGGGAAWGIESVASGDVVMTGQVSGGTVDFGDGPVDVPSSAYVVRYGPSGEYRWARLVSGSELGIGLGLSVGPGERTYFVGLAGTTVDFGLGPVVSAGGQDAFVAGFEADGSTIFGHLYGGPMQDRGHGVVAHPDGRILATGRFTGTSAFGDGMPRDPVGGSDLFLLELR